MVHQGNLLLLNAHKEAEKVISNVTFKVSGLALSTAINTTAVHMVFKNVVKC